MRCFLGVVFTILVSAVVESAIVRGPINIVGIHHEKVTLHCSSGERQTVTWTFTPIGQSLGVVNISGHHVTSWSSRGDHSLTLESLTFSNAGKYVCRVVGTASGGFDAAAAYVVVVADPPRCTNNFAGRVAHGDPASMECSVTFIGQHNLTLEWLAPNGTVILRKDYLSGTFPHVARLRVNVTIQSLSRYSASMPGFFKCRASFSNRTSQFGDQASNAPEFRRNTCMVPLPSSFITTVTTPTSSQPPESAGTISVRVLVIVIILSVCLLAAALIILLYFNKAKLAAALKKRRRNANLEDGLRDGRDNVSNSRNHDDTGAHGHELQSLINGQCEDNKQRDDERLNGWSEANGQVGMQVSDTLNSLTVQSEPEREPLLTAAIIHTPEAAAAETTAARHLDPSVPDGDNRPISDGRSEPETNVTSVQENADSVLPTSDASRQESTANSPDSTNSPDDIAAAGHNRGFVDLRADSYTPLIAQANDEHVAEDEVDQSNT